MKRQLWMIIEGVVARISHPSSISLTGQDISHGHPHQPRILIARTPFPRSSEILGRRVEHIHMFRPIHELCPFANFDQFAN
jgi:hypothetical protein